MLQATALAVSDIGVARKDGPRAEAISILQD